MRTRPKVWSVLAAVAFAGSAIGIANSASATTDTTPPDEAEEAAPETTEFVPPERGAADLVIWADDLRADAIGPLAEEFAADEGLAVAVVAVPFDRIRDTFTTSAPAGEGPDIIVGAYDWLGELVSNGSLAPIDLGASTEDFAEAAIQAFTYEGQIYGVPYATENIALIRNTDLVPEAPATFEELEEIALQLVADGEATIPLAVQQDPGDPYHNFPLFSAFGGYVFGLNEDGSYNVDDVGIDSAGGLAAADAFAAWSESGLISSDVTYDVMIDAFASGSAPFAITGPWAVNDPAIGFVQSGVPFVVEPIPPVQGGTPQVFVGVQGFMVSQFSENVDLATTFLLDYVGTEELQLALYEAGGRPPALLSAVEQIADDPVIQGFGAAAEDGVPQPAIPEMSAVYENWTDAYALIFSGSDPQQAFTDAADSIRTAVSG